MPDIFTIPFQLSSSINLALLGIVAIAMLVICFRLIITKSLIESVMILSIFSLIIGICYLFMDAPDVAMTETSLGVCLSTCVLLHVVAKVDNKKTPYILNKSRLIFATILCIVFITLLTYAAFDLPLYGDKNTHVQTFLTNYYIDNTSSDIGIPSIVAAILASYRGYDTLGETTVILVAGLGVLLILARTDDIATLSTNKPIKSFLVIKTVLSFVIPYIILYGIYIQLNGETSPGGGFQAGVIIASAIIAYDLIIPFKVNVSRNKLSLIVVGVIGVLIYASTGLISFLYDDNYLNYDSIAKLTPLIGQYIGIFAIELGVGITVSSIMCLIYLSLQEE